MFKNVLFEEKNLFGEFTLVDVQTPESWLSKGEPEKIIWKRSFG